MFLSKAASVSPEPCRQEPFDTDLPAAGAAEAQIATALVSDVMKPIGESVVVDADMDLGSLTALLLDGGLNCVAVRSPQGTIIGFVSMADLVRDHHLNGDTEDVLPLSRGARKKVAWGFHETKRPRATVRSIMMPFLLSVQATSSLDRAAALMSFEGVHRLLVRSPRQEVVGIVSAFDVLRWYARRGGYAIPELTRSAWRHKCEYDTGAH